MPASPDGCSVHMNAFFFSDAHLDKKDRFKTGIVERFLRETCAGVDMVFILGDLFEFYHGYEGYIFPWYRGVAQSLRDLTRKGSTVYFIEGNHEFGMGRFFEEYTGARIARSISMDFQGRKAYISHGYEIKKYPLTRFLKTPFVGGIMDAVGPRAAWRVAEMASVFLSNKEKPYNEKTKNLFREYAAQKLDEGYDVVLLGHSHMPDRVELPRGGKVYLNTGDIVRHGSYVEYESRSGFALKYLPLPL